MRFRPNKNGSVEGKQYLKGGKINNNGAWVYGDIDKGGVKVELQDVKKNLNKRVELTHREFKSEYILTACILRKGKNGIYYTAELQDIKQKNSVIICRLEDVKTL